MTPPPADGPPFKVETGSGLDVREHSHGPALTSAAWSGPQSDFERPAAASVAEARGLPEASALDPLPSSSTSAQGRRSLDPPSAVLGRGARVLSEGRAASSQPGRSIASHPLLPSSSTSARVCPSGHDTAIGGRGVMGQAMPAQDGRLTTGQATSASVPGATASAVTSSSLWKSIFDGVIQNNGDLSTFLRSSSAIEQSGARGRAGIWPVPVSSCHSWGSKNPDEFGTEFTIALMNWLVMGKPRRAELPGSCRSSAPSARSHCEEIWIEGRARVKANVKRWNEVPEVSAEDMGRAAVKVESIEKLAGYLERNFGDATLAAGLVETDQDQVVGRSALNVEFMAKEVEAERLSFHGTPSFDPRPYLDAESREIFERPLQFALKAHEVFEPMPRVRVRASRQRKLDLLATLDQTDRLLLVPSRLVRGEFPNGMFCIPKDLKRDRLILDARRPNAAEITFHDEIIEASGEDIRDYYYAFQVGLERSLRNHLAGTFAPAEVSHFKAFEPWMMQEPRLSATFCSMAMGDVNAVGLGQASHLGVIFSTGTVSAAELMSLRSRPSRGLLSIGVVIDDFICLEKVLRETTSTRIRSAEVMGAVQRAYEQAGLPRHSGKSFFRETTATFWGAQLDGERGEVWPNSARAVPLAAITLRIAHLGLSTIGLLEVLAGSWVSVLSFRRRTLSLLQGST